MLKHLRFLRRFCEIPRRLCVYIISYDQSIDWEVLDGNFLTKSTRNILCAVFFKSLVPIQNHFSLVPLIHMPLKTFSSSFHISVCSLPKFWLNSCCIFLCRILSNLQGALGLKLQKTSACQSVAACPMILPAHISCIFCRIHFFSLLLI